MNANVVRTQPARAARRPRKRTQLWSKPDQGVVCTYVRDVADTLGLSDWTFRIRFDDAADADAIAQVVPTFGQRDAVLLLSALFAWSDPQVQRATICHELIHCILAPITEAYGSALTEAAGQRSADVVDEAVSPVVEVATETLAIAVAELVPLPSFGTPKVARPTTDPQTTVVPPRRRR